MVNFRDYQKDAIQRMHNGCILCGGVGSGKSITALGYYYIRVCNGEIEGEKFHKMRKPRDLYIITTARKRDTKEWEAELCKFCLSTHEEDISIVIDSWNNIGKYKDKTDSFFIFDEQRVVGSGAWVKAFLKIAKTNQWILLSATPGDTWMDYVPVFVANGYFKNRTEFTREHVVYKRFAKFPQVERYLSQGKLLRYKNAILVNMAYTHETHANHQTVEVDYDKILYKQLLTTRWNIFKDQPIMNAGELCYTARRVINSDPSRIEAIRKLLKEHEKVIIFYNYDYELELLKSTNWGKGFQLAEWNGHKHERIPSTDKWIYLVQYNAGAEGWNCVQTDTIIFYSLNYSYKIMTQAAGRIDRMNTPFTDLYYYRLKSSCPLDLAISRALKAKQNFNENRFFKL